MTKFGVFDHMDDTGRPLTELYAERVRLAEAYDRAGLYGYHLAEHHATPLGCAASPGLFFAAIAHRTKRLRFGPLVYLLPFYHPIRLIEEICMLDQMSGGRFELGIGRGISPFEAVTYDLDFKQGPDVYRECFEILRRGLGSDELTFAGAHYRFDKVPMVLRPVQRPHPPLWVGTLAEASAVWPAANDANIVTLGPAASVRAIVERYRGERVRLGKDPDNMLIGVGRHVVVADTDAEALRIARRAYPRWVESFRWLWKRHGTLPGITAMYPDTFDEVQAIGNAIAGSPRTVSEFIAGDIAATGVNYFVSWFAFGDLTLQESLRSVDLFASEVMPAFAGAAAATAQ
jgi:alkanesulfonate monooxygenase SsuD/methylene tetrahydromethanopterin reductase-like flavin-dependent oxidoreductase (luciferase family)